MLWNNDCVLFSNVILSTTYVDVRLGLPPLQPPSQLQQLANIIRVGLQSTDPSIIGVKSGRESLITVQDDSNPQTRGQYRGPGLGEEGMLEVEPESEGRPGDGVEVKGEELHWQPAQFIPVVTEIAIYFIISCIGTNNSMLLSAC